jgi:hypothetical protein
MTSVVFPSRAVWFDLRSWPPRRWAAVVVASTAAAIAMGIPTGIVPSSIYSRMTPVTWWDYPIWAGSALLIGLIVATYVRVGPPSPQAGGTGKTLGGGVLSVFAIGCPICNKVIVALIGVSGALSYWAPLQPFLGLTSVGLLTATLALRLRGLAACRVAAA